ncbi:hypothetical protein C8N46_103448 [Kordia periserrulae]|uniref:Uncharacterized protein n=1 Tax=Kordia periserrulae TaxID=701523 RepID=A0A2T6C221_9FLAO|nr:hypothetical protein [Kordia periserrulae]PTX62348.1 hypothetical protein C8N46_103448 [Kordia periserrulae]
MPITKYYPPLSDVVSVDDLPDVLSFIKDGIQSFFDNIYYKDLQYSKSLKGDAAFYSLDIVSRKRLSIELPGTGIFLVLNPDQEDFNISSFPITVFWEWKILAYKRFFNLSNFSFSIEDLFNLSLDIFEVSELQVIDSAIRTFVVPVDSSTTRLEQFVNDVNALYGTSISIPINPETELEELVFEINQQAGATAYLSVLSLYILTGDAVEQKEKLNKIFSIFIPQDIEEYLRELFIPKARVTLELSTGIEFPRNILKPVYDENGNSSYGSSTGNIPYDIIPEDPDGNPKVVLSFGEALFYADTEKGLGYNMELVLNTNVPAQIGNTGLIIDVQNLKIDLSRDENILEADLDGRPPEFMGVYTDYTAIILPKKWFNNEENHPDTTARLAGYNLLVGTGGISGTMALEVIDGTSDPKLIKKLGNNGFEIWFTSFDITFQQGHIVESDIQGGLKIPRLKDANGNIANIDIFGHLDDDGGFNVTASEQDGFQPIIIPNVLELHINSLEVGRESNDTPFYIGTACDIVFTNAIIKKFIGDQRIVVERLRIYSDGSFEIVGGAIAVPTNFTLNLGPVEISVTGINFGSFQEEDDNGILRKYNFFGFDGGISLGSIGVEARGEGVKYFYTVDDAPAVGNEGDDDYIPAKEHHSYIKIETIEVDLTIPGNASASSATAIIKGWLSINEVEYAGGVSLKLPKLKMAGGANMRLQPKPPAFLIDAYLDIPIPIPLAATGLGITGFRGLMGFRYVAEKEAVGLHSHDDSWYDYYTHPPRGVDVSKFNGPDKTENYSNPISLGAGMTVATMGSNNIISLRVMVLLSIPNMLMIDGRASILSKEWGLDDSGEPPFFAFMILADNGIEIGAGVDFKLPQNNGSIIDLHAYMQAGFFWDNPSGWYLNMGTREDPITAKVLSLVEMESFLMLSGSGIEAGAKVSFDINERFGPIGVKAHLIAEVGGFISFERPQIGGYMTVDAGARVDLFGIITVGVSFYVHFSVEAANPFLIYAEIRVCGRIKLLFVRIKICATVKIKWEKSRKVNRDPIPPIAEASRDQAVKGIHMLTGETFELINFGDSAPDANSDHLFNDAIIPLDTYVDIKFEKALLPGDIAGIIGSYNSPPENYEDIIPPVKVIKGNELRQVKHRYQITDISIKAAEDGSNHWVDYHPYEAVVKGDNLNAEEYAKIGELRIGHWQKSNKEYNAIRLLASSPFSYTEQGEPDWFVPEQIGLTPSSFFCSGAIKKSDCANWLHSPLDTNYHTKTNFPYYHTHQNVFFNISQGQTSSVNGIVMNSIAKVVDDSNIFGFPQSLKFPNTSALEFKFPKPSKEVTLKLSTNAQGIKVIYYTSFIPEGSFLTEYVPIDSRDFTPSDLTNQDGVTYTSKEAPISKIKIYPIHADQSQIDAIYEQIEALFAETYEELQNDIPQGADIKEPLNTAEYYRLLNELKILQNKGCHATIPIEGIGNMQIQSDNYDERVFEVGKTPIVAKNSGEIYCQIYNEIDNDGIDEYRFRVYNFDCKIILSSSTRYHSKEAAIREVEIAINNILSNDESILIKQTVNGKWYFNIIDETKEVVARRIQYFIQKQECLNEINDLKTILQNHNIVITEDSCIEKDSTPLIIDDSCDPCSLHQVLLNHYNNCFLDDNQHTACFDEFIELLTSCGKNTKPIITGITFPSGNCCEEVVELLPIITGITFPNGNCCEEVIELPPIITGITFPSGNCCEEVVELPPIITGITFPNGNCCEEVIESPPIITGITFPNGNCCEEVIESPPIITGINFPNGKCCEEVIESPPIITGITFPNGNCCEEVIELQPVITGINFPNGNCCEEVIESPPVITGIAFPNGNCCEEIIELPPIITGITFPNGNCCKEVIESPPIITGITFPEGNCCEITLTNGLAVTLLQGTCSTQNLGSSFTYYVSNYNIQNGHIIYIDASLIMPLNISPNQNYYFGGTSGVSKRSFSVGLNGVVSNMSLCTTNDFKTALQADNCNSYSGQGYSVSVIGDGRTIGNQVFIRNTLNSFNGNYNWYRFSSNTNTQDFYPNFNHLKITSYIVKIDINGVIIQVDECI